MKYPLHIEEGRMVLEKAGEQADCLHTEAPGTSVQAVASIAIQAVGPNWDVNVGSRPKLERY